MSMIEKRIFTNINDVKTYLQSIGFIVSANKILWSFAESTAQCYWKLDNDIITFQRSDGENAFRWNLVDFDMENRPKCAIVSIKLQDNGIALYMGMVPEGTNISQINISCSNVNTDTVRNGLIILSPPEDDNHWYYTWNNKREDNNRTSWCLDNGHGNYEYPNTEASQLSSRPIYSNIENNIVITQLYLNTGYWSKNIFAQVVGYTPSPGSIFKLQGQKYIAFTANSGFRCPVYKLAADPIEQNLSTSTDPYSSLRTYVVGDYCTFNGYVYRCTTAIQTPEPFDDSKWVQTTVPNELLTAGDHIYGA